MEGPGLRAHPERAHPHRMSRRHIVITGTGRAGTSFLVAFLTRLGLDTGFDPRTVGHYTRKVSRAGLEHDVRKDDSPFVVKDPGFCDYVSEVLAREDIAIEHVIIPMRDLHDAAESRRRVHRASVSRLSPLRRLLSKFVQKKVGGGLWDARTETEQEIVLLRKLYRLVLEVADADVPVTLLRFPRLVEDAPYLFQKLRPILGAIDLEEFQAAFAKTAKAELVDLFGEGGSRRASQEEAAFSSGTGK